MFSSLIATALLSFSVSSKSVFPVILPTNTHNLVASNSSSIYGVFNYKQTFIDFEDKYGTADIDVDYTFEDTTDDNYNRLVPCHLFNYTTVYLKTIEIHYAGDSGIIYVNYNYYNNFNQNSSTYHTIYPDYNLDDVEAYTSLMIYFQKQYTLHDDFNDLFYDLFTTEDNAYVKSYSGYYNFTTNVSSFSSDFSIFGFITFNNNIYRSMYSNYNLYPNSVYLSYFDNETNSFATETFTLPFDSNVVAYDNILMSNVKMTTSTYTYLSNIGVWSYVRDTTYDNAGWQDLLFGVMDSPIYMISRLLSFELFGINLFVALTGLLTICVILVLIRKF